MGIKTLFFIAPSVWAWRSSRVKKFIKFVDHLAVIYPFEPEFFKAKGYSNVTFVGHPLASDEKLFFRESGFKENFKQKHQIPSNAPLITIFPGSRKQEVSRILPPLLSGFKVAKQKIPNLQATIPIPRSINQEFINELLIDTTDIFLIPDGSIDCLLTADAGIIKSGTSNVQATIAGLPFTMIYKVPLLTELIVNMLVTNKTYSMTNIIRPNTVREIIQREVTQEIIGNEIIKLVNDHNYSEDIKNNLLKVKKALIGEESNQMSTWEKLASLALTLCK